MDFSEGPVKLVIMFTLLVVVVFHSADAKTHHLNWEINYGTANRTCATVVIPLVNNQFPGPTVEINEGDTLIVNVTSLVKWDVTIHWHGINQFLTNWADGADYITQCPLQQNTSYTYEFTVDGQSGTFFWHAHTHWLRETLYGALVVHPKSKPWYASKVYKEIEPILFGEWFSPYDPNLVELGYFFTMNPTLNVTIANTINSYPGHLLDCNVDTDVTFEVIKGKTYLLRLVNNALNNELFFTIRNHTMTVVGADGSYLKPFKTSYVYVATGQTTNVLVTFDQPKDAYHFGVNVAEIPNVSFDPPGIPALGIFKYKGSRTSTPSILPTFPSAFDLSLVSQYVAKLRGLEGYTLSKTMDHDLLYPVGVSSANCYDTEPCVAQWSYRKLTGSIQNYTFVQPTNTSVLEAYYSGTKGVYETDLPDQPVSVDDWISSSEQKYLVGKRGTKAKVLKFNDTVQVVLQNFHARGMLAHPFHLHGQDFYVIGRNLSNYDAKTAPRIFNLVDPPKFNTFTVPTGGWVAIRFKANNPGVWFLHCHFERHKSWGMAMVFITENGVGPSETLPGPKHALPKC